MANNAFGIDLGTNNIKIYNRNDDNIMIEKNMIAIENKNTLFAYGNSAFEMYEKAPSNIHISYPLSNGVIADIKNMETLVKYFIGDLQKGNTKPSDFFIAVPTDVTEVEKREDHGSGEGRGRRSGPGYRCKKFPGRPGGECRL